jgi:hypothetical protein
MSYFFLGDKMKRIRLHVDVMMTDEQIQELQEHVGEEPTAVVRLDGYARPLIGRFEGADEANGEH